ncbi:hypothetical protein KJS94_12920 [Flavihumibacter rivuli]|uniref:hypothetical protein n=1 Tax=Flavihumibacter rivuli TaxID=2838156 RepID=UPI001BDF6771|nr:hypothetical protein [Flavihumibacter rivuli]ULQ55547.1 hypothetical protein KJS94_12920 [Flavihumibacter rivuli]
MVNRVLPIVLLYLCLCLSVWAQDQPSPKVKAELHGYIKNMPSVSFLNSMDSVEWLNLFHNRINFSLKLPGNFSFKTEMRNRFFAGSQVSKTPGLAQTLDVDDGLMDLSFVPINEKEFVWHTNIDRLNLNWHQGKWDITLGRQRINWGIHTIWNPNDLFNTFNYLDFDYEERPGSDAIRMQYNVKEMKSLELAWKAGKDWKNQVTALKYRFNLRGYDWQFLGGRYVDDWVIGSGWAGSIGQLGFKGEASYFHPASNFTDTIGTLSFTTGLDYTLEKGWYFSLSYLLNSSGDNRFNAFGGGLLLNPTAKSLLPFRHTSFLQAMKVFNPLLTGTLGIMYAPGGTNFLLVYPSLQYSVAENWELAFFSQHFFGNQDEFKTLGNALYLRVKWNF